MSSPLDSDSRAGIVNFDFDRWFPHIFWISQWTSDDNYPEGYCYKLLSVRDEAVDRVDFVVLLTEPSGDKQEMTRFSSPVALAREAAQFWIDQLSDELGLDFEEQDYSTVRTAADFYAASERFGSHMTPVDGEKI